LNLVFPKREFSPICATGSQFFLRFLRKSPGEKTAMQRFLLSAGKLTFAKIAPRAGKAGPAD
ncbi:MAG: hypothetical protein II912_04120, partial [Clostridia bacterium]|nr:hypothetical protein [Clostridia bacterium]